MKKILLSPDVNIRQVFVLDFNFEAQVKMRHLYEIEDFWRQVFIYFCLWICCYLLIYITFLGKLIRSVILLMGPAKGSLKKALQM